METPELLEPYAELLLNDEAACDITFASRYEAFVAGVQCGRRIALGPSVSERGA